MRWLRALIWGLIGALPGAVLFALPGFVEGQADNLFLSIGGLAWVVVGLWIGLWAGSLRSPARRRVVAFGAAGGAILGLVLLYGVSWLFPESSGGIGLALFGLSPLVGALVGSRVAPSEAEPEVPT